MAAMLKRLTCFAETARPIRRKATRKPANSRVRIESTSGELAEAILADASPYGCSLRCEAPWLRTGRIVALRLGKEEAVQAVIRWTHDGAAAHEFRRAVPPGNGPGQQLPERPWLG